MRPKSALLITLIGMLLLLSSTANAQNIDAVLENTLTDNLESAENVKQYSFEMSEPGDAIILVAGLQEKWDGYAYHWRCVVYRDDLETVITYADVRGYSVNYGPSILSAPNLDAGIYYVRVTSTSSANPLMTKFTSDPYQIQFFKYYHSASATYNGDGYQTFHNSGDILWDLDGTAFLKLNDGECYGALMETKDGAIVPILVSTDKAAVEYIISDTGKIITAAGPWHDKASNTDYYYSHCEYIGRYTDSVIYTSSLPILYVDAKHSDSSAAKEVINVVENGPPRKFSLPGIIGGIIVLIIICFIVLNHDGDSGPYDKWRSAVEFDVPND